MTTAPQHHGDVTDEHMSIGWFNAETGQWDRAEPSRLSTDPEPKGTSLNQTEIWVDRQGVEHRVDDMSVRYKANVIGFLERRASHMVARVLVDRLLQTMDRMAAPVPCVIGVRDGEDVECEVARGGGRWAHGVDHQLVDFDEHPEAVPDLPKVNHDEAVAMVRRTPFMQRLIADVEAGRGGDDG